MTVMGVDVASETLQVWTPAGALSIANADDEIEALLSRTDKDTLIGVEATGVYHLPLALKAHELGFTVFVLNPLEAAGYAKVVSPRAKTDRVDAWVIARYVEKEHDRLREFTPLSFRASKLRTLVRRRGKAVLYRQSLRASLRDVPELKEHTGAALEAVTKLIEEIDRMLRALLRKDPQHAALLGIPGVGFNVSAGLMSCLLAGEYRRADNFVSYLGLDLRVRDSGKHRGKRKLTKRGDPEVRRLLYCSAMRAATQTAWRPYFDRLLARGLSKKQCYVALMRRIARCAWSMYTHQTTFDAQRLFNQG